MPGEAQQARRVRARFGLLGGVVGLRAWLVGLFGLPIQVCYFAIFYLDLRTGETFPLWKLLLLVFSLWLYLAYIVLINDLSDREIDARAGKATVARGHALSPAQVKATLALIVASNAASVLALGGGPLFEAAWVVAYALGTLYSVPPASLKRRGFLGFLSDALIEKPLPVLMVFAFFNYFGPEVLLFPIIGEMLDSVFKHQERDYELDAATGMRTFAVSLGKPFSTALVDRWIHPVNALLVLAAFAVVILELPRVSNVALVLLALLALGLAAAGAIAGRSLLRSAELGWLDPPYVAYLNGWFNAVLVPVLGIAAAVHHITYLPLLLLLILSLFPYAVYYERVVRKLVSQRRARSRIDSP